MLELNDKHQYFVDGKRVPGVTEVCKILAPRFFTDEYFLNRGRIIHLLTEYEDAGELDESTVDPALSGYLKAYRQFKIDTGFKVMATEQKFYAKRWGYCGRADKWGELFSYYSVLDIKSGGPHEADRYQSAMYLFGLKEAGFKVWRAWDLYLKKDGKYNLIEQKRPSEIFNQALEGIKKWHEQNRLS